MSNITKGDNLQAFNGSPIKVTIVNPTSVPIKTAYAVIDDGTRVVIVKEFPNPEDVIHVKLDSIDTNKLGYRNRMKIIAVDVLDRKRTLKGELIFETNKEVWHGPSKR